MSFCHFFFLRGKTIKHSYHLDVFNLSLLYLEDEWEGELLLFMVFPQFLTAYGDREDERRQDQQRSQHINNVN